MQKTNQNIREAARAAHVPLWRLADEIGISEPTMTRKLRRPLSVSEQETLLEIIQELEVVVDE